MKMRIAYLMTVHRNPLLLQRLIGTLSIHGSGFFIHIDRKTDIGKFSGIGGDSVFLSEERIPVYWGEFSQVEATIRLMRQALARRENYDYFVFLQGGDYPIRSGAYIQRFFEANRGHEFINITRMPAPGYPLSKINKVWYPPRKPLRHIAAGALAKLGLADRDYKKYLGGLEAYAGHACWALSRRACEYIVQFAESNPHVEKYFRDTCTPDEMYFHTVLGNSPFQAHTRRNLVYQAPTWSIRDEHRHQLSSQQVSLFSSHEKFMVSDEWGAGEILIARKFSDDRLEVVDRIDEMIQSKPQFSCSGCDPLV
jgi:hypothetical protein